MPVCTSCAHPAEYLYTTYRTKSNIRLGVCPRCWAFQDPLIEHPPLIILLDLILLKPRVFLHLIYNRGSLPLDATRSAPDEAASSTPGAADRQGMPGDAPPEPRSGVMRGDLVRLAGTTLFAESLVRIRNQLPQLTGTALGWAIATTVTRAMLDLAAQHCTTTALTLTVLWSRGWWTPSARENSLALSEADRSVRQTDGRKRNFRPIMIPLTLLYTSILPLLLQLILGIWHVPALTSGHSDPAPLNLFDTFPSALLNRLPPSFISDLQAVVQDLTHVWHSTDRIWAGTRLLGGMSAGFGLRTVLPTKPWETTGVVLAGWAASALISQFWA